MKTSYLKLFFIIALVSICSLPYYEAGYAVSKETKPASSWQNPNVGFVLDMTTDVSDVEKTEWTSKGVNIRSAELAVQSNIDPFGSLTGNFNFSEHGAALHEAFFELPYLPGNLKFKGGYMLANFGRWNRFHTHAMPFVSEPRVYAEYIGGHLTGKGGELSWLVPLPFYIEITLSAYDGIRGHTHDSDPVKDGMSSAADRIAVELGYSKHGNHYHKPDGSLVIASDLVDDDAPIVMHEADQNLRWRNLAYGGRMTTTIELGENWSVDLGGSLLHQPRYKKSQRIADVYYAKTLYGGDLTVFWHPLTKNLYRNLSFGVEFLGNYEDFERVEQDIVHKDTINLPVW